MNPREIDSFFAGEKEELKMLAIFSSSVAKAPKELNAAGSGSPNPKRNSSELLRSFLHEFPQAISLQIEGAGHMAYTRQGQDLLRPRSFAVKDEIFCLFEGMLANLPSLRQQYGLSKSVNEIQLVIEAYKTLRDRAPYPANQVVGHLDGQFAFVIFDRTTGTVFVASDSSGRVPLYWGVTADGYLAFCNDAELLKGSCGKSLASFPGGCLFSSAADLRSYQHPLNRVTAVPTVEGEIFGTTFKVEGEGIFAGIW